MCAEAGAPTNRLVLTGNITNDSVKYTEWLQRLRKLYNGPHKEFFFGNRNDTSAVENGDSLTKLRKGEKTVIDIETKDGLNRTAIIYVPQSLFEEEGIAKQKVPLLLMFHGLGDNCDHFLDATDFISLAEQNKVILASGCGTMGFLGLAWNAGMCCGFSKDGEPDDVGFVRALTEVLLTELPEIDPFQVASMGFSNGAMLSEVLACTAPDLIRAVMSVGGVTELRPGNDGGLDVCDAAMNNQREVDGVPWGVHLLFIHGDSDWKVPWTGNKFIGFPSIPYNTKRWLERQGCYSAFNTTTIHTEKYENIIYPFCEPSMRETRNEETYSPQYLESIGLKISSNSNRLQSIFHPTVELVRAKNVGHIWPSDQEFDTGTAIFKFLEMLKD